MVLSSEYFHKHLVLLLNVLRRYIKQFHEWHPLTVSAYSGGPYNYNPLTSLLQRRMVWVSCAGERPGDVEALGPLRYWPHPGLHETYFPYDNTPGYLSPLVAVQLMQPRREYLQL